MSDRVVSANQNARVLAMLRERPEGITSIDVMTAFGCTRLAARIAELRSPAEGGHHITAELVMVRNREGDRVRVARYRLVPEVVA